MALIIFNFRKSIFKHIILKPNLKEQFLDSVQQITDNLDMDLNPNNEYVPSFILEIMNPRKSVPLTFDNFSSNSLK